MSLVLFSERSSYVAVRVGIPPTRINAEETVETNRTETLRKIFRIVSRCHMVNSRYRFWSVVESGRKTSSHVVPRTPRLTVLEGSIEPLGRPR